MEAVKSGKIACHLTEPNEIKAILGEPQGEDWDNDGAMRRLVMYFPVVEVHFSKFRMYKDDPVTLRSIIIRGTKIDIKGGGPPALRNVNDLRKLDDLHDVSLKDLDLADQGDYLKKMDFYTSTLWPPSNRLPPGFDPQRLLEEGKNPGLRIRALHEQGINGKGIGIAILDQPLLLGHEEYTSRLIRYDATKASWLPPQFHGSPIAGIAVGKTCGVAPGAFVFYYAGMTTVEHRTQADWIHEIVKYNETVEDSKRIRVISISASPEEASSNDAWREAHKKAQDAGILVVTCSVRFLDYGTLTLIEGKDPDKPESYKPGRYADRSNVLRIPAGNRTIASHLGVNVYDYIREGGMSWAAPYIAGLAALAFQVNPDVQPQTIVEQLVETATHTKAGPVVNPRGFIESIRQPEKKQ
ncbi:MAG: S8 family serine peptidase [Planctomycetota bacterium]|jgi:subtilisin family serine protease